MFLIIVFTIVFLVSYASGTGLFFSVITGTFMAILYAISNAGTSHIRRRLLRIFIFIAIFTAIPLGVSVIMANTSNLTQRVGGRDFFVDGIITASGFLSLTITLAITALIISVSKEVFVAKMTRGS